MPHEPARMFQYRLWASEDKPRELLGFLLHWPRVEFLFAIFSDGCFEDILTEGDVNKASLALARARLLSQESQKIIHLHRKVIGYPSRFFSSFFVSFLVVLVVSSYLATMTFSLHRPSIDNNLPFTLSRRQKNVRVIIPLCLDPLNESPESMLLKPPAW